MQSEDVVFQVESEILRVAFVLFSLDKLSPSIKDILYGNNIVKNTIMKNDLLSPDFGPNTPQIVHRIYQFYLSLYVVLRKIPKQDRYAIGQKCEHLTLEILEDVFLANSEYRQAKLPLLQKMDTRLKILKTCLRLGYDTKALDQKKYLLLQENLQEIGKMLGGWMKSIK
jgi:hypothetical protein